MKFSRQIAMCVIAAGLHDSSPASAFDVESSVGIYYFTSNQEMISGAQTENAEENQVFSSPREPRQVATDFARDELMRGNVCLSQAEHDLRVALRSKLISRMCREIFQDEISGAMASARKNKQKEPSLQCEASFEARETPGFMSVAVVFRSSLMIAQKLPEKLTRAGFAEEPKGLTLPAREALVGQSNAGWKGVLKSRACSLGKKALEAHLERFLEESKETRLLTRCQQRHDIQIDRLQRLQSQFRQYVPEEWLAEAGGSSVEPLLLARSGSSAERSDLKSCRESRRQTGKQLDDLRELSESIANKHDVPALNPKNQPVTRELASDDLED